MARHAPELVAGMDRNTHQIAVEEVSVNLTKPGFQSLWIFCSQEFQPKSYSIAVIFPRVARNLFSIHLTIHVKFKFALQICEREIENSFSTSYLRQDIDYLLLSS